MMGLQAFGQASPHSTSTDTITTHSAFMRTLSLSAAFNPDSTAAVLVPLPGYTQGLFCDLEDAMNRNRRLRIDLGVK